MNALRITTTAVLVLLTVAAVGSFGVPSAAGASASYTDSPEDTPSDAPAGTEETTVEPLETRCGGSLGGGSPVTEALARKARRGASRLGRSRRGATRVRKASRMDEDCSGGVYYCRTLHVAKVMRDSLMPWHVVLKFWMKKRWCWRNLRVFKVSVGTYVTDVDPNFQYEGVVSSWDDWYAWCCGRADSGHVSHRTGRFDNCILRIGCLGSKYPWVRIRARGDGSYTWRTGS